MFRVGSVGQKDAKQRGVAILAGNVQGTGSA